MASAVWNLFHEMDDCISPHQRRFGGLSLSTTAINAPMEMIWAPTLEISQTSAYYLIKIKMPRASKQEVRVKVDDGIVTFSGEREPDTAVARARLPRTFVRSFSLPPDIDDGSVAAQYADGVLSVRLLRKVANKVSPVEAVARH
jgi:HSP20 family protein